MATQKLVEGLTYAADAGEDLSSSLHRFAHVDTDGDIVAAGAGDVTIGTIHEAAASGEPVTIQTGGIMKVQLGSGGITAGQSVKPAANGKGVNASSAGDVAAGVALESGSEDEVVSVLYYPHTIHS